MIFKITLKDPDGVYESVKEVAEEQGIDVEEVLDKIKFCVRFSEYVTITIDTEQQTAVVAPVVN